MNINNALYIAYYVFQNHTYQIERPSIFHKLHFLKNNNVYIDKNNIFNVYTVITNEQITNKNLLEVLQKYHFPVKEQNGILVLYENENLKHIYIINNQLSNYVTTIKQENFYFSLYKAFKKDINFATSLFLEKEIINSNIINNINHNNILLSMFCEEIQKCIFIVIPDKNLLFEPFYEFLNTYSFSFFKFKNNIIIPELFFYMFLNKQYNPL